MKILFSHLRWDDLHQFYEDHNQRIIVEKFIKLGDINLDFFRRLKELKFLVRKNYSENLRLEKIYKLSSKEIKIDTAYFFLTTECNLRCDYCLVYNSIEGKHQKKQMSLVESKKYVEYFYRNCDKKSENYTFTFYGGEPLLSINLVKKIIEYCNSQNHENKKLNFILLTNGLLIDKNILQCCQKYNIHLVISIDGSGEITKRQRLRSNENFELLIKNIRLVQKMNVSYGLSCTVSSDSVENTLESFTYLIEELNANNIGINYIIDTPNSKKSSVEYAFSLTKQLIKIHNKYRGLNIYEDRLARKIKAFTENNPIIKDCTGCGKQIVFTPKNQIGPCQSFAITGKYFTSFNENLLISKTHIKEWNKITPFNKKDCTDCIALGFCGGGCPFRAFQRNGDIQALDDIFCIHSKVLLNHFINLTYSLIN